MGSLFSMGRRGVLFCYVFFSFRGIFCHVGAFLLLSSLLGPLFSMGGGGGGAFYLSNKISADAHGFLIMVYIQILIKTNYIIYYLAYYYMLYHIVLEYVILVYIILLYFIIFYIIHISINLCGVMWYIQLRTPPPPPIHI